MNNIEKYISKFLDAFKSDHMHSVSHYIQKWGSTEDQQKILGTMKANHDHAFEVIYEGLINHKEASCPVSMPYNVYESFTAAYSAAMDGFINSINKFDGRHDESLRIFNEEVMANHKILMNIFAPGIESLLSIQKCIDKMNDRNNKEDD